MTHVHAVVGGENHNGIVRQTVFFQFVKQTADVCVHGSDRRIVAGQIFAAFLRRIAERCAGLLIPVDRQFRRCLEFAVFVQVKVFLRVIFRRPRRVRRGIVNFQTPRRTFVFQFVEEAERTVGDDVGHILVMNGKGSVFIEVR